MRKPKHLCMLYGKVLNGQDKLCPLIYYGLLNFSHVFVYLSLVCILTFMNPFSFRLMVNVTCNLNLTVRC